MLQKGRLLFQQHYMLLYIFLRLRSEETTFKYRIMPYGILLITKYENFTVILFL